MSLTTKYLSPDDQTAWAEAVELLSEEQLIDAIRYALKWAPPIEPLSEPVCCINRSAIPETAWSALLEMESWGAARRRCDSDGEALLASEPLLKLVMRAIQLLLEGLATLLCDTTAREPVSKQDRAGGDHQMRLRHDADAPSLG